MLCASDHYLIRINHNRRESVDPIDLVYAHVGAIDCYALGLRKAAEMHESGELRKMLDARYLTWNTTEIGKKIEAGEATLDECAEHASRVESGGGDGGEPKEIKAESGRQELFEIVRNRHLYG